MSETEFKTSAPNPPVFGMLSLIALVAAAVVAVVMTRHIASTTSEMASIGAVAGIGLGFITSIAAPVLAAVGLWRRERPPWPARLGISLGLIPGLIGLWMLISVVGILARGR